MSEIDPTTGAIRRANEPSLSGDTWVTSPTGERYWGRFGAAGLLAVDAQRGVLLQHRIPWSHFGGTWGIPGGALQQHESAVDGAIRESEEEADSPPDALAPRATSVLDLGFWSYTTVIADVIKPFEPYISDYESQALEWVPIEKVSELPLHPGFADSWPALLEVVPRHPLLIVDAANVVGARPDGWWKDRPAAAGRLRDGLASLRAAGVDAAALGLGATRWFADMTMVLEGEARALAAAGAGADAPDGAAAGPVGLVEAARDGDGELVAEVERQLAAGRAAADVVVVTSDRELAERVGALGASVQGAGWLWEQLDAPGDAQA